MNTFFSPPMWKATYNLFYIGTVTDCIDRWKLEISVAHLICIYAEELNSFKLLQI